MFHISEEKGKHVLYIKGRFESTHDSYSDARMAYDTWLDNHTRTHTYTYTHAARIMHAHT